MKIRILFQDSVPDSKNVLLTSTDDSLTSVKYFLKTGILPQILIKNSLILRNHFLTLKKDRPIFQIDFWILGKVPTDLRIDSRTLRKKILTFGNVPPISKKDSRSLRNVLRTLVEVWWCFEWGFLGYQKLFPFLWKVLLRSASLTLTSEKDFLNLEKLFLRSGNHFLTSRKHYLRSGKTAAMKGNSPNPFIHLRSPPREQKPKINGSCEDPDS